MAIARFSLLVHYRWLTLLLALCLIPQLGPKYLPPLFPIASAYPIRDAVRIEARAQRAGDLSMDLTSREQTTSPGTTDGLNAAEVVGWVALLSLLLIVGGAITGCTIGFLGLDLTHLEVIAQAGGERESKYARAIIPYRRHPNKLICCLVMAEVLVSQAVPVVLNKLIEKRTPDGKLPLEGVRGMLLSAVLNFIFMELVPQSLFVKYGLKICGRMVWFIQIIMLLFCIPTAPVWLLLHYACTGFRDERVMYDNQKLLKLIELHSKSSARGGELDPQAFQITSGVIDMHSCVAMNIMKDISQAKMLDVAQSLDHATIKKIIDWGYTKLPVFDLEKNEEGERVALNNNTVGVGGVIDELTSLRVLGFLDVKKLAFTELVEGLRVGDLELEPLPLVPRDYQIFDLLRLFQDTNCRMAVVVKRYPVPSMDYNQPQMDTYNLTVLRSRPGKCKQGTSFIGHTHSPPTPWTDHPRIPPYLQPLGIITYDDILQRFFRKPMHNDERCAGGTKIPSTSDVADTDTNELVGASSSSRSSSVPNSASSSVIRSRLASLNRRRVGSSRRAAATHGIQSHRTDVARIGMRGIFDMMVQRLDSMMPKKGKEESASLGTRSDDTGNEKGSLKCGATDEESQSEVRQRKTSGNQDGATQDLSSSKEN